MLKTFIRLGIALVICCLIGISIFTYRSESVYTIVDFETYFSITLSGPNAPLNHIFTKADLRSSGTDLDMLLARFPDYTAIKTINPMEYTDPAKEIDGYVTYSLDNGCIVYAFFNVNSRQLTCIGIREDLCSPKDFQRIKIGQTSLEEVIRIDKNTDVCAWMSLPTSFHCLDDNTYWEIRYLPTRTDPNVLIAYQIFEVERTDLQSISTFVQVKGTVLPTYYSSPQAANPPAQQRSVSPYPHSKKSRQKHSAGSLSIYAENN